MRHRQLDRQLTKLIEAAAGRTRLPCVWCYRPGETAQDAAQRAKAFGVTNVLAVGVLSEHEWLEQAAELFGLGAVPAPVLEEVHNATEKE